MSLGPSITSSGLLHQSLVFNKTTTKSSSSSSSHTSVVPSNYSCMNSNNNKFSYRTCPICSKKLLVRINGSFVYKWISTHFASHHHEYMHVVVNLQES